MSRLDMYLALVVLFGAAISAMSIIYYKLGKILEQLTPSEPRSE